MLGQLPLELENRKTRNLAFRPKLLPDGVYGRTPALRPPNTKNRVETQHREAATLLKEVLGPHPAEESNFWAGFWFPATPTVRIKANGARENARHVDGERRDYCRRSPQ